MLGLGSVASGCPPGVRGGGGHESQGEGGLEKHDQVSCKERWVKTEKRAQWRRGEEDKVEEHGLVSGKAL